MIKDDAWWLRTFYICFGAIVGFGFWKFGLMVGVQTSWMERYDDWFGYANFALSVGAGIGGAWYLSSDKERNDYLLSSISELRKVTWPNLVDTRRMTVIVCVVVGIFAVILAIFDFLWAKALGFLLA